MNYINLIYLCIIFGSVSCINSYDDSNMTPEKKEEYKIEDETLKKIDKQVCSYGFKVTGFGGENHPVYRKIFRSYGTNKYFITTIKDARELFFDIYKIFATNFDHEKRIKSSIDNQPFSENNLELTITFYHEGLYPCIRSVQLFKGKITYFQDTKEEKNIPIIEESFADGYGKYLENKTK